MASIIPKTSLLYPVLGQAASSKRVVLFAGLPGVGKSLLLQQLSRLADQQDRTVHLLQWDVTRAAFETEEVLLAYPEVNGTTHALIRKAVGLWARGAVARWHTDHPDPHHILVGEAPLIGNRLVELVQLKEDAAEELLSSEQTLFFTPVPSKEVRARIETARKKSIAAPQHAREAADAPPNVLAALWLELTEVAARLGLREDSSSAYNPVLYARVYEHLLRHRHCQTLFVDEVFSVESSVYDTDFTAGELAASLAEVAETVQKVEQAFTLAELAQVVADWYKV